MRKQRRLFNSLFVLIITFSLLAGSTGSALAKRDNRLRMDPDFLQMVREHPDDMYKVIVQKIDKEENRKDRSRYSDRDTELEESVHRGGGRIQKRFGLIVSFSAEMTGREIEKLTRNPKVYWVSPDAPVVSTQTPELFTIRDMFESKVYDGNDGTVNWTGSWIEGDWHGDDLNESPINGNIEVNASNRCAEGFCLEIDPDYRDDYIYREVNLENANSATLSFYRYNSLNEVWGFDGEVDLEISSDGGATWKKLRTFSHWDYTGGGIDTFDITSFASTNTRIRFYVRDSQRRSHKIYFDNIQIEYAIDNVGQEETNQAEDIVYSAYREVVGAEAVWQETALDGAGITVAVVDSGISDHIDLHQNANNPTLALSTSSRVISNVVFGDYTSPIDEYAHGTHVAGIIGGNGVASGGEYKGIAPGVNLLNVRVSNNLGLTYTSDVVDGLQWVYDNKDTYNIRVVNLSITSTVPESYHTSPLAAAVEILWFNGITVVVSAGNNGTVDGPSTLYPPANDPFVITVGAIEDGGTQELVDDFVGAFSAYGTTESGFAKPELVAPGRNLISLLASTDATAYVDHPKHHVNDFYFRMSGTSMAAPVVSGTVALLLQDEPNLTPDQVKYRLMVTANRDWPDYDVAKAGAGTVDAYAAVVGATTESANLGIIPSQMLSTGEGAIAFGNVGWNTVGWNTVGWNTVGWNTVGWNTVGWNTVGWNTSMWDE